MGPSDHRRIYSELAEQLASGEQLLDEQWAFLKKCFERLAAGEDANAVFGLNLGRGQSAAAAESRQTLSALLHIVAGLVDNGESVAAACVKVSEVAQRMPGGWAVYDADYLRKCWYKFEHMQSPERMLYDPDFPYAP